MQEHLAKKCLPLCFLMLRPPFYLFNLNACAVTNVQELYMQTHHLLDPFANFVNVNFLTWHNFPSPSVSHTTDDLIFVWDPLVPLVVDDTIELPQLDLVSNSTGDCTQVYSTGQQEVEKVLREGRQFGFGKARRRVANYYIESDSMLYIHSYKQRIVKKD